MAVRVLSLAVPALLVFTVAVNTATRAMQVILREDLKQRLQLVCDVHSGRTTDGDILQIICSSGQLMECPQQREAAGTKLAPLGNYGVHLRRRPSRTGSYTARNKGIARIIDGKPAYVSQFPHQANIDAQQAGTGDIFFCGGTLINKRAVLTSVLCVEGYEKWTIRLGGIERTGHEETAWTTVTPWAIVHPEFNDESLYADLAIIYLIEDAPLSDYIKLAALPSSLEVNNTYLLQSGVISGWGDTSLDAPNFVPILQWTEVTVICNTICQKFYPYLDMRDKLCAANQNVAASAGDLGTGLHLRTQNGFKIIGILAVYAAKNRTRPAAYTKVASYIDWINIKAPINN